MARPSPTVSSRAAPVLAVLVCHDGEAWLPGTLDALAHLTRRPRWVIAVDTGSADGTAGILASSNQVDVVLRMPRDTGFAEAVHTAVDDADRRWGRTEPRGSGDWLWVLHDDAAPAPNCLEVLLSVAETSPSAAVLGPLCLDWDDPRLVVEAGVSIDASGSRQTGIAADELDLGQFATNSEVLAVGSAGSLVRRREWDSLGGYDTALGLLREDVDYGWRVNRAGGLVLCAPSARLRHARGLTTRARTLDTAGVDPRHRATDRAHGVRTFLANCSSPAFVLGLLRLPVLAVLRALGFLLVRRTRAAGAELAGLSRVLGSGPGLADLADARRRRGTGATALPRELRGLLTSRTTRLRNAVRGGLTSLVRGRLREELDLGRVPEWAEQGARSGEAEEAAERRPAVGPEALPAGAALRRRRTAGLRRPGEALAVALPGPRAPRDGSSSAPLRLPADAEPPTEAVAPIRPSDPRPAPEGERVVYVPVTPGRVARELLLAPPLLLVVGLTLVSVLTQRARLGLGLAGGRIAEVPGLRELWSSYLAGWHPIAGGTGAPAPAALAVVGTLGGPVAPLGGPPAAVSILLIAALPLAGLSAYLATRDLRVGRVLRALAAAVYALLGITAGAVAQGRLDGVVAAVLLPLVLAGVVSVLRGVRVSGRRGSWWSTAAGTALALGVVSAFAPLVHALVLVVVVIGFVLVPAPPRAAGRRAMSLAVIVLLPVLLLLPWPTVLLAAPEVLLHGTGSPVPERFVGDLDVLSLDPGGDATVPWAGLLLVVLAVGVALVAPRRAAVPGLALLLLGIVAAGVVGSFALPPLAGGDARPGWTGPALALAACGALWSLLAQVAAARTEPLGRLLGRREPVDRGPARRGESELDLGGAGVGGRLAGAMEGLAGRLRPRSRAGVDRTARARSVAVPVVATAVAALAVVTVLRGGSGALADTAAPTLAPQAAGELAAAGARVVVVTRDPDTTRRAGPELPRYGDDDLAPVAAAPARLQRDVQALLSGDPATAQAGVAELATGGTGLIVLPDAATARSVRAAAGPLLTDAPPVSDGRPTARVALPVAGAVLLEPPISDDATEARAAPRRPAGLTTVPSDLPTVAVRVSPGADRRLLVVAAELESGWSASVGGAPAEVVPAWGHLVGVSVPPGGGPVVVDRDETVRLLLLLLQLALVLFTALSALPSRKRLD
ncbi:glycosyltransferase family 2 protein [Actinomycetospora lutea]|uniref:glycosyltransferase family 2 protein n=1 Tax=Actinomycetospora lutea TaxID=663604 RepID=UPI0023671508|nr:glycosyltransferase family 2 protein [Actinomycetospora lutea]MDD7940017.1 glycosyltransferase family 2 protein [Actinomycetospora lutea]